MAIKLNISCKTFHAKQFLGGYVTLDYLLECQLRNPPKKSESTSRTLWTDDKWSRVHFRDEFKYNVIGSYGK